MPEPSSSLYLTYSCPNAKLIPPPEESKLANADALVEYKGAVNACHAPTDALYFLTAQSAPRFGLVVLTHKEPVA